MKKLDDLVIDEPIFDNINTFEKSFSESIRLASEETIPKSTNSSKVPPWINDDLSLLHDERRLCKEPNRLRELHASMRKLRNKLKNDYFSDLASNIILLVKQGQSRKNVVFAKNTALINRRKKNGHI